MVPLSNVAVAPAGKTFFRRLLPPNEDHRGQWWRSRKGPYRLARQAGYRSGGQQASHSPCAARPPPQLTIPVPEISDYSQRMDQGLIESVRRFNRTVTQRIGALDESFLSRGRPLGQARVLWEIGQGRTRVRALRSRLGLDSGYLSRLLRALEADGLIVVSAAEGDRRVRVVRLTQAGLAEHAELDRRSDDMAAAILGPLTARQRGRLTAAMDEAERLLTASMIRVAAADPRHPSARYCLRAYFTELSRRFDNGFDPDRSIPAEDRDLTPPAGVLLVATLHDEPVGCGALKYHGDAPAEVKRMWVSPAV